MNDRIEVLKQKIYEADAIVVGTATMNLFDACYDPHISNDGHRKLLSL